MVMIVFLHSCIIYREASTIDEASSRRNTHIKIITKTGYEYKLKWIEEKNGYLCSIENTKRVYIKKDQLSKGKDIIYSELFNVENKGDYISGLRFTGKDTVRIVIPVSNIEAIKITDRGASIPANIVGWGLFSIAAGYGIFVGLWYSGGSI